MKQEKIQLTPEEELQAIIDKAKKKHGRVYKTILADEVIIWRMLKRSEYKEINPQKVKCLSGDLLFLLFLFPFFASLYNMTCA